MLNNQNTNIKQLTEILQTFPGIEAAYLFGSHSVQKAQKDSDIDVGLIGPSQKLKEAKVAVLSKLAENGFSNIDLVIFNEATIQLQYEIIHPNHLLFARNKDDMSTLFSITLRKYWDFKHLLTEQADIYKEKLLNG
jgi:predicted nucleotidyltransferase